MAAIKIAGNVYVIEAGFTLEDLKLVQKYRPNLLKLFDEEKQPVFCVSHGATAAVGKYGIQFTDATKDERKLACVTLELPKVCGDVADAVAEAVGPAFASLEAVEANVREAIASITAERESVKENIVMM